jgi:WYL_2, Sm-like SH3 beta-barrel fold
MMTEQKFEQTELDADQLDQHNQHIRNCLGEGVWEVEFTKVNGELRTMPCTLDRNLLPPRPLQEHHDARAYVAEVLSVWCTDKQEWRSFRVANVRRITRLS